MEYTPFDLPSTVIQGQTNVVKTTRFDYSADEERVARRDADTTRHFVADLYQRLIDNTSGGTLEERFRLYAGSRSLGEIVRKSGSADQTLFFHTDQLGSVDTVSTDTGEVFRQEFDAFGMPIDAAAPSTELTRAGFTGHQHDGDLGLIDMKGRVYDPLAARFMSADPVTQAPLWTQGLNRYSYVFNDPINHTDPSGFFAIVPGYPAGAVVTGSPLGLVGVGIDVGLSVAMGIPSSLGSTGSVTLGSVAPTTGAATQGGVHAAQQNKGGVEAGVQVQEGNQHPTQQSPRDAVYCGAPGAPKCAPMPAPKDLTEMDRLARDFIRRHARIVEILNNEFGTAIRKSGGRLVTFGEISISGATPGGPDMVAIPMTSDSQAMVHLHPGDDAPPTFSETDIESARKTGLMSYVSVNRGQFILRFDPGANTITRLPGVWGQTPTGGFVP